MARLWVMRYGIAQWKQTLMSMVLRDVSRAARTSGGGGSGSGGSSGAVYFLLSVSSQPEEDRRSSGGASGGGVGLRFSGVVVWASSNGGRMV